MPQVVEIPLQPLTPEAFASFGQILGDFDAPPVFEAPHLRSWRLDFSMKGAAELMVVRYLHQPLELTAIERHFDITQSFIPLGDQPSVMVVAAPTDPKDRSAVPEPETLCAFYVPGDRGIMLWPGTWHALTRFPVRAGGAAFAMITGQDTQRELERQKASGARPRLTQEVDYLTQAGLRFRVVDPHGLAAPACGGPMSGKAQLLGGSEPAVRSAKRDPGRRVVARSLPPSDVPIDPGVG